MAASAARRPAFPFVLLFAGFGLLAQTAIAAEVVGDARVKDGDTIEIDHVSVRLHGVDAPEIDQMCGSGSGEWPCGEKAKVKLAAFVKGSTVRCIGTGKTDQYRRMIAKCSTGGQDLGGWMVEKGWARAYLAFSEDYVDAEAAARAKGKGIWSGELESPWDFSRRQRHSACDGAPGGGDGCKIKGNINAKRMRIYHVPGSKWYAQTKIDTDKGERWFCSREEAEEAGWRAAR